MRDYTEVELCKTRPTGTTIDTINFCLNRLFEDGAHNTHQEIVNGLTFEELIGALLLARDDYDRR